MSFFQKSKCGIYPNDMRIKKNLEMELVIIHLNSTTKISLFTLIFE